MKQEPEYICPGCRSLKSYDAHFALCVDCDCRGDSINPALCGGCLEKKRDCKGLFVLCDKYNTWEDAEALAD